jgi:hypothetical protein
MIEVFSERSNAGMESHQFWASWLDVPFSDLRWLTKDVRAPQHPVWAWLQQAGTLWETNLLKEGSAIHKEIKREITDLPEETFPLCILCAQVPSNIPGGPGDSLARPWDHLGPATSSWDLQLDSPPGHWSTNG